MNVRTLPEELAHSIVDMIKTRSWREGTRLPERTLAEELRVSRSPVRIALKLLHDAGVLSHCPGEGYVVADPSRYRRDPSRADDEAIYLAISGDRIAGKLPDRITESELTRRYALSRAAAAKILSRIASEGWVERLPGNGWAFLPALTSEDAYRQSFRFRLINEPAAILEPTFVLNESSLLACRSQQLELIDGEIRSATAYELFEINSYVHEAILECSGNSFIIDSIKRINRLRRLMDMNRQADPEQGIKFCQEHVQILDLLLEGRRQEAADSLRLHLSLVSRKKVAIS